MRAALFLLVSAVPAAAQSFDCTVQDFVTFSKSDTAFVQQNLEKRYRLTVGEEIVTLEMFSKHFTDAKTLYRITQRRISNLTATDDNAARHGAITLPLSPRARIGRNGYFNATVSVSGSFYSNTWLLHCR